MMLGLFRKFWFCSEVLENMGLIVSEYGTT
jgi:hypothetical protein